MSKRKILHIIFSASVISSFSAILALSFSVLKNHYSNPVEQKQFFKPNDQFQTLPGYSFPLASVTDIAISNSRKSRPQLSDSIFSAKNHFIIHYTTDGKNAVAKNDSNANSIPDRIEKIADVFEKSYTVEIEQMNYKLPPSFQNGIKPYDIYVLDLNNSFGITVTENVDSTTWEQKNVSSYILFDNDFAGPNFHIQGDGAIKSTAAHEFFHAIQLGYVFRKMDGFFFEMTAVWIEDHVFDEVDNYLYYMDYFFNAPDIPLNGVSYTIPAIFKHIYGSCIFGFYIEENFGRNAIRQIWELMPNKSAFTAANEIFISAGSNFENEFVKFSIWNFFTGSRSRSEFYSNGANYPEIALNNEESINYFSEQLGTGYHLTAGYYLFHSKKGGDFKARMIADSTHHWKLAVAVYDDENIRTVVGAPGQPFEINDIADDQNIVLIPCNIDRYTHPVHVYFKDTPEAYTLYLTKKIEHKSSNQQTFSVEKIYPNPFSSHVIFSIKKLHDSPVSIQVFNIRGQEVFNRTISELPGEINQLSWSAISDNQNLPTGLYFAKFSSGNFQQIEKLILCR